MKTPCQVRNKIIKLKKKLKSSPICENFGDKEIRALDDYVGDIYEYSWADKQVIFSMMDEFQNWCANYNG